jgi:indole-3-glycerol phosphate synthase
MGFLTELCDRIRADLRERPPNEGSLMARARVAPPVRHLEAALRSPGIQVVAEVKRASPSAGAIAAADPGDQAARYERAGAAAVSVLTEPRHFDGSLADLRSARRKTHIPLLRKDFLVHPAQVAEARAEGADAVLLIAEALSDTELADLRSVAEELGMAAVVEAHAGRGLERAVGSGASIIGVNARDLETLQVDLEVALRLAASLPEDRVVVVESGIRTRAQIRAAEAAGADAVLVGEVLMRSPDPEATIRELLGLAVAAGPDAR